MPRLDYKTCKGCGKSTNEVGLLSWTRLCQECGKEHYTENHDQLRACSGPYFDHWRRRLAASVSFGPLDARDERP